MENLARRLFSLPEKFVAVQLNYILKDVYNRFRSVSLSTAGLVITATTGKKVPKTGASDSYSIAKGVLQKIASGTDMPALVGTVVNATFNVFLFTIDSAGTVYTQMGTAGATLGAVIFPSFSADRAIVGFIIINPTGTGDFVGGTTALDDGTVVPNTVYQSPVGAFDPTANVR